MADRYQDKRFPADDHYDRDDDQHASANSESDPLAELARLIGQTDLERKQATDAVPLRRLGTLDDIGNLALFLASPYGSYISGAVIPCDGGGAFESVKPALESAGRHAGA